MRHMVVNPNAFVHRSPPAKQTSISGVYSRFSGQPFAVSAGLLGKAPAVSQRGLYVWASFSALSAACHFSQVIRILNRDFSHLHRFSCVAAVGVGPARRGCNHPLNHPVDPVLRTCRNLIRLTAVHVLLLLHGYSSIWRPRKEAPTWISLISVSVAGVGLSPAINIRLPQTSPAAIIGASTSAKRSTPSTG